MRPFVLGLLLLPAACTANVAETEPEGASSQSEGRAEITVPTISFGADWSVKASGPITSGGKAKIHYDIARQPLCRTRYRGFDAWGISAYFAVDGGFAKSVPVTQLAGQDNVPVDVVIDVPLGKELAIWFHASDEGGCSTWDSNYGANFRFALVQDAPVIHFASDWSTRLEGVLKPDADVLLDYDLARLPGCRATYNGYQTWDVVAHARFDGGAVQDVSLTATYSDYERHAAPARVHVPAGARSMELWFDSHDRTGCQTWDSRYGANYAFGL